MTNIVKTARHVFFNLPIARDVERLPLKAPVRGPLLLTGFKLFSAGGLCMPVAFMAFASAVPVLGVVVGVMSGAAVVAGGYMVRKSIDPLNDEIARNKNNPDAKVILYEKGCRFEGRRAAIEKIFDCRARIASLSSPFNQQANPKKVYKEIESLLDVGESMLAEVRITRFGRPVTFNFFS